MKIIGNQHKFLQKLQPLKTVELVGESQHPQLSFELYVE